MELTQLNPKIERYLVETQKIIDHDPAMRKKLWMKLTFSFLGLLVMLGSYLWFEYLLKKPAMILSFMASRRLTMPPTGFTSIRKSSQFEIFLWTIVQ